MLVGQHNQIATGVHWLLDGHIACPMPATVGWEMLVWRFWNTLSAVSNNLAGVQRCREAKCLESVPMRRTCGYKVPMRLQGADEAYVLLPRKWLR